MEVLQEMERHFKIRDWDLFVIQQRIKEFNHNTQERCVTAAGRKFLIQSLYGDLMAACAPAGTMVKIWRLLLFYTRHIYILESWIQMCFGAGMIHVLLLFLEML